MSSNQCFTIFEGGGAKGITHLGALKALEDVQLARIGAAGTSAGAIIAALTAVGYDADELFNDRGGNILARMGLTPVSLLGDRDWGVFSSVRGKSSGIALIDALRKWRLKALLVILGLLSPLISIAAFCYAVILNWPPVAACLWRILDELGFFSTESARDILNTILCTKLGLPAGTPVCFRHIDPVANAKCCRLKIITTNLTKGGIELFDDMTPDVVVADAVAASFSIPVFFKPSKIRRVARDGAKPIEDESRYVDGGLLSNLPAWVFFEDKRNVERLPENSGRWPIPIVAFRLDEAVSSRTVAGASNPVKRFASYVGEIAKTGIFGGQSITQKFITHLQVVGLPTPLSVIQFDCTRDQALDAYRQGRDAARDHLQAVFQINPFARQEGMQDVMKEVESQSHAIRSAANVAPIGQFRASLLRPLGDRSLKVIASLNMQNDADDDLVLDQKNPGAPTAFYDRDVTFVDVSAGKQDLRMTKYERALVRHSLASVISVPIFESAAEWTKPRDQRGVPVGAFCLDSDSVLDLEFADPAFLRALTAATLRLAPFMSFDKETS